MYDIAPPLGGATVIGGTLAYTGADTFGMTLAAIALLVTGLLVLRMRYLRRARRNS